MINVPCNFTHIGCVQFSVIVSWRANNNPTTMERPKSYFMISYNSKCVLNTVCKSLQTSYDIFMFSEIVLLPILDIWHSI